MKAEVIAVGSELVSGQRLDTNSQWLSERLGELGIAVHFHATVGDDLAENAAVFRTAVERADLVIATGGLGPTQDDLTREALAQVAGTRLELHEPSLEHIRALFERRGRQMPERNRVQALFPNGSEPLSNPHGTAPGIWIQIARRTAEGRATFVALPGVPSEMKRMFHDEVRPRLEAQAGDRRFLIRRRINCFGLGESDAEEKLLDLTQRGRQPEVGITVHEATITLRIMARGASEDGCRDQIESTAKTIYDRLGDCVFGEEDDELQHAVGRLLQQSGLTLATAESGTGGIAADRLTDVPNLSEHYPGGVVVPSEVAMVQVLGVSPAVIRVAGRVGREVAGAMAIAVRERFGTDMGLAITEGPPRAGEKSNEVQRRVLVALSTSDSMDVVEHSLTGDPTIAKSRAAKLALNAVRIHLLSRSRT